MLAKKGRKNGVVIKTSYESIIKKVYSFIIYLYAYFQAKILKQTFTWMWTGKKLLMSFLFENLHILMASVFLLFCFLILLFSNSEGASFTSQIKNLSIPYNRTTSLSRTFTSNTVISAETHSVRFC